MNMVLDENPLEPRFVVWRCDHCRNGIEFDAVQLAGRKSCRTTCPHCGRDTSLQEPPPPPRLIPDEGWTIAPGDGNGGGAGAGEVCSRPAYFVAGPAGDACFAAASDVC